MRNVQYKNILFSIYIILLLHCTVKTIFIHSCYLHIAGLQITQGSFRHFNLLCIKRLRRHLLKRSPEFFCGVIICFHTSDAGQADCFWSGCHGQ